MNRSQKSSNIHSSLKLDPIPLKTISSLNPTNPHLKNPRHSSRLLQSLHPDQNSPPPIPSSHHPLSNTLQKQDVQDLERKILNFDAKDDGSIPSKHLFDLRRNYDNISKQLVKKEIEITKLKGETEVLKRTIAISRQSEDSSKRSIEDLQKNVNSVKSNQLIEQMNTKCLEQMIDRMRKDEVVHKTRVTLLDKKIKNLESGLKDLETKHLLIGEQESSNLVTVEQIREEYKQTTKQRQINFSLYHNLILKKQGIEMEESERMKVTETIQAMASNDTNDTNFVKYKKLMQVHMFLRKILKGKITGIEEKYYDIKKSYNKIQLKTTITDPRELSKEYFEMEGKYRQYLEDIRGLEETEKELVEEKEELEQQWKSLQTYEFDTEQAGSNTEENEGLRREMELMEEKYLKINLVEIRMNNYIWSSIRKLDICRGLAKGDIAGTDSTKEKGSGMKSSKKRERAKEDREKSTVEFCQRLLELSKELQEREQEHPHFESLKVLEAVGGKDLWEVDEKEKGEGGREERKELRSKQ